MIRLGFWLCVFGALSLFLPRIGYDLYLIDQLGESRIATSVAMLVIGAGFLFWGWKRRGASKK
jgi:uncharacterized membrane protein YhhN